MTTPPKTETSPYQVFHSEASASDSQANPRPTNVRHVIVAATTLAAFLMYLDRACLGWMISSESFQRDMHLTSQQTDWLMSAFFWAYALAQVPSGWLAERYGKRVLMSSLILLWSAFTALTGFSSGLTMLLIARIGCGIAEAGAYPISGSLLSRWANINHRGVASSIVSLGGRLGLVLAPFITAQVILRSGNWRFAGWTYGAVGIAVAVIFWFVFRETPEEHPACNDAEREYLAQGKPKIASNERPRGFPWRAVLTDQSVWLMCGMQFLTNLGWAFIINSMAKYWKNVLHVSDSMNGILSTVVMVVGFGGLLTGGYVTDICARRFGVRMGRLIPLTSTRFIAAAMLVMAVWVENPWLLAFCFGAMAFATDAGAAACWAWAQDVGGRQVAPILGWANMWGNFGAAVQPLVISWLLIRYDVNGDWSEALLACAAAFALSGVLSLGINAARPIDPAERMAQG